MISFPLSQIYFLSDASSLPKRWGTFYCFTWLFVASLSREVASAAFAEVGGSLNLMKPHSLSRLRRQRLAAARSRHGSDSPPDCHSLPCRHFATPEEEPIITFADTVSLRLGHAPALNVHRTFIHYRRAASLPYRGAQPIFFLPWVDVGIDPYKLSIF